MNTNQADFDLCVIGGGINGAGIARDAAGRGLSTLLVEAHDLGGATSSASTKLIHGGLRYLEFYEFKLVRESLQERTRLLRIAPHIIRPLKFILPHEPHLRPAWMIQAGLFLYDHLGESLFGRRVFNRSRAVKFKPEGPLRAELTRGFSYADCWVDDARLVVLNALDAAERGGQIMTRTKCVGARVENGLWHITLRTAQGAEITKTAKQIVNATGPWVRQFLDDNNLAHDGTPQIRLVRGSHIIVPKLYEGPQAYILQQEDRRIVFAIPYEDKFTLIGTTEQPQDDGPESPRITPQETDYLCAATNQYFKAHISPEDVVWSYSGVRPLLEDGADSDTAATRDYKLTLDNTHGAPLLSVFGGKITTYRHLAQEAVDMLTREAAWTDGVTLPGGDVPDGNMEAFTRNMQEGWPFLPAPLIRRYARLYGTRMVDIIGTARSIQDMGHFYGDDLFEAELRYLVEYEWARKPDDILWRRTKCGLHIAPQTAEVIAAALPPIVKEYFGT